MFFLPFLLSPGRFAVFFRFCAALLLVVLVSMAGVTLEKRTLELRRAVSLQYYHTDLLVEQHVKLRLETQQLTAPSQLSVLPPHRETRSDSKVAVESRTVKRVETTVNDAAAKGARDRSSQQTATQSIRLPLLRFQQPFSPEALE